MLQQFDLFGLSKQVVPYPLLLCSLEACVGLVKARHPSLLCDPFCPGVGVGASGQFASIDRGVRWYLGQQLNSSGVRVSNQRPAAPETMPPSLALDRGLGKEASFKVGEHHFSLPNVIKRERQIKLAGINCCLTGLNARSACILTLDNTATISELSAATMPHSSCCCSRGSWVISCWP